jgi:crossover junction endodeoxyribonuclease RuvC
MDVLAQKLYAGIDPGVKGAVAVVNQDGKIVDFERMPSSLRDLRSFLNSYTIERVYIEKAQPMPGQGVVSMFNYGRHFGGLLALLELGKFSHETVNPRAWQKVVIGMGSGDPKAKAFEKASRLWPDESFIPKGCRVPHNGIIDALLIAEYGRRLNVG